MAPHPDAARSQFDSACISPHNTARHLPTPPSFTDLHQIVTASSERSEQTAGPPQPAPPPLPRPRTPSIKHRSGPPVRAIHFCTRIRYAGVTFRTVGGLRPAGLT